MRTKLDAAWRATIKTHEADLEDLASEGSPIPTLFRIRALRLEGVIIDILHCVDQGVASHLIANVFVEIMALGHWGPNQDVRVKGLEKDMHTWQKAQ